MNSQKLVFITLVMCMVFCSQKVNGCNPTERYFPGGVNGQARAIAILRGTQNGQPIRGILMFVQNGIDAPISVSGNITGLPATGKEYKLGFHVHERAVSVLTDDVSQCLSTGLHFNPTKVDHGNISDMTRHAGDWGNVVVDATGLAKVDFVDSVIQLYGPLGILGRAVVLHVNEDDLGRGGNDGSKLTGNAGGRIACGVIGIF